MITHYNQFLVAVPRGSSMLHCGALQSTPYLFLFRLLLFSLKAFRCVRYCHLLATVRSTDEVSFLYQRKRDLSRPRRRASPSRCSPSSSSPTSPPSFTSPSSSAGRSRKPHAGAGGQVVVKDLQSSSSAHILITLSTLSHFCPYYCHDELIHLHLKKNPITYRISALFDMTD